MSARDDFVRLRCKLEALEDPAPLQLLQAAIEHLFLARQGKAWGWAHAAVRAHLEQADQHWRTLDAYLAKHQPGRQTLLDSLDLQLQTTQGRPGRS